MLTDSLSDPWFRMIRMAAFDLAKIGVDAMQGINGQTLLESTRKLLLSDLREAHRWETQKPRLPVIR